MMGSAIGFFGDGVMRRRRRLGDLAMGSCRGVVDGLFWSSSAEVRGWSVRLGFISELGFEGVGEGGSRGRWLWVERSEVMGSWVRGRRQRQRRRLNPV